MSNLWLGERFWSKVGYGKALDCWPWQAYISIYGYGQFNTKIPGMTPRAHRLAYMQLVGGIPPGLVLDHLCRNRACVNPYHCEPVTHAVNTARGDAHKRQSEIAAARTHCRNGHERTDSNVIIRRDGSRTCRQCGRIASLAYWRKKNGKQA